MKKQMREDKIKKLGFEKRKKGLRTKTDKVVFLKIRMLLQVRKTSYKNRNREISTRKASNTCEKNHCKV